MGVPESTKSPPAVGTKAAADGPEREGTKWLVGGVAAATLVFGLVGLTGNSLGRAIRTDPNGFKLGLLLVLLSVAVGVLGYAIRSRTFTVVATCVGLVLFVTGTYMLVTVHATATNSQERPAARLSLARSEMGLVATVDVDAAGLKSSEYVFLLLEGFNSKPLLDQEAAAFVDGLAADPGSGRYWKHRIYKGRIGPGPDGTVDVTFNIALAPDLYEQVVLQTVIADSESGEIEEDTLINGIDGVFFACNSVSSDVGCATVLPPDPPRADG